MRVRFIVVSCALWCACGGAPADPPNPNGNESPVGSEPGDAGETEDPIPPLDAAADAETEFRDAAPPPACEIDAPTACPDPMPRYDDVKPIFTARCTGCHNGLNGMWSLGSYQHVADWYAEVRAHMLTCTMPPAASGLTMPLEERLEILNWIRCGVPR